jgi:hypothetical protein
MFRLLGGLAALEASTLVEPVDIVVTASLESCFVMTTHDGTLRACDGERMEWEPLGRDALRTHTPMVWPPPGAYDPEIPETLQRVAPFHWGGLLLPRQLFDRIGGYCQQYIGWGCEDEDLLVKITADGDSFIVRGWQADHSWNCLHLEHLRRYVATTDRTTNRILLSERLASGTPAMIQQDLRTH